ncbi:hypothetical protein [Nocardioides sp.]|uniref:hypothetical protein n=1 Tax=Nocardioides sp. TaxID=35761 RepID=UPI002ED543FE
MPLFEDPLPRPAALLLREAVRRHAGGEHRRRFAPVLHVGRPGGRELSAAAALSGTDHALRSDVCAALLARTTREAHLVWLTRPGELEPQDVDLAWLAAAASAYAEAGRDLTWVVVTRHGWWDPRSGLRRQWQRIRG